VAKDLPLVIFEIQKWFWSSQGFALVIYCCLSNPKQLLCDKFGFQNMV